METHQLYGVLETVPEFRYRTYIGNKLVGRQYEGHRRVLAAFASKREADAYKKTKALERNEQSRGGYYQIHEREYRMVTEARYEVGLVDVFPSVVSSLP